MHCERGSLSASSNYRFFLWELYFFFLKYLGGHFLLFVMIVNFRAYRYKVCVVFDHLSLFSPCGQIPILSWVNREQVLAWVWSKMNMYFWHHLTYFTTDSVAKDEHLPKTAVQEIHERWGQKKTDLADCPFLENERRFHVPLKSLPTLNSNLTSFLRSE